MSAPANPASGCCATAPLCCEYNAGYVDYKIAQMYKLNDAQRKTVITRGISNSIVRRMNDKAYWLSSMTRRVQRAVQEWIPRKWLLINADTPLDKLEDMMALPALIGQAAGGIERSGHPEVHAGGLEGGRQRRSASC